MSQELFNRASMHFDKYLRDFQADGTVYMLPRERMTDEMWEELNKSLIQYGIRMIPAQKNGVEYMKFSALPRAKKQTPVIAQADNDLGQKLKRYTGIEWEHKTAENSGLGYEHYRIRIDTLPQDKMSRILDILNENAIYDANPIQTNKGQFLVVKPTAPVLDSVFNYYRTVTHNGVPAYVYIKEGMGRVAAEARAEQIIKSGEYYADVLNKDGYAGADYIVVAIKKSDAEKLGAKWDGEKLCTSQENATAMARLDNIIGKPLTYINGVPVEIESKSDFGVRSGRPIVVVTVGKKRLPFYISSGTAGKTDVPTGKWEFFGGIDSNGWFRKGRLEEIINHYHSPELKQIADALDTKIGDLRDTKDVLKTIGRETLGAKALSQK